MKQSKTACYILLATIGFIVMCAGVVFSKWLPADTEGILKTLPYLLVGVGAGIFGGNLGAVFSKRAMMKNPQAAKQVEIEQKDERNQAISNKAKAKAYDCMLYVYAVVLLVFSLIQVDMYVVLTLVVSYLFFIVIHIYYLSKYHREM